MAKKSSTKTSADQKPKVSKKSTMRTSWLDPKSNTPLIDDYARQAQSFLTAMADGVIEKDELRSQEEKLVNLMKEIEPKLDDDLHEQVTQLLCEVSVYDFMQMLMGLQETRPEMRFRG